MISLTFGAKTPSHHHLHLDSDMAFGKELVACGYMTTYGDGGQVVGQCEADNTVMAGS